MTDIPSYTPPATIDAAIAEARANADVRGTQGVTDITEEFVNGPRVLSSSRLSYLTTSIEPGEDAISEEPTFNLVFFTMHCIADGVTAISTANDFLGLITLGDNELQRRLKMELVEGARREADGKNWIPVPTEARLPSPKTKVASVGWRIDHNLTQNHLIVRDYTCH